MVRKEKGGLLDVEVVSIGKVSHLRCALKGNTWGEEKGKTQNGPQDSAQGWRSGLWPRLPSTQSPLHA